LIDDVVEILEPSHSGQRLVHSVVVRKLFGAAVQKPPVPAGEWACVVADPFRSVDTGIGRSSRSSD
jgi:hypothetical protein